MRRIIQHMLRVVRFEDWPILINILKGDLSFIGPRPERPETIRKYAPSQRAILTMRPGIWGPYDLIKHRNGTDKKIGQSDEDHYQEHVLPRKLELELRYSRNRQFGKDLRLLYNIVKAKLNDAIHKQLFQNTYDRNFFLPIDVVLVALSYFLAYQLRFDWAAPGNELRLFLYTLPIVVCIRIASFYSLHIYRNLLKYVGIKDLLSIITACSISSVLIVTTIFLFGFSTHSRSVFLIDWIVSIFLIGGSRLNLRLFNEKLSVRSTVKKKVVIMGAGDVGEMLLRELHKNGADHYEVVGFLDDDAAKHGRTIHGVKVLGDCKSVIQLAPMFRIDEVLITIARASSDQIKAILRYCKQAQVRYRIVPAVSDLLSGRPHLARSRKVEISDLFGRQPVELDLSAIESFLKGKRVLVTGAGGSIGSELCRQIAEYKPERLALVDKNENYLHAIQCEMAAQFESVSSYCHLCNITNKDKLTRLFEVHRPEIVFHAAAHKHVPLSEENPEEAIWNNIIGSKIVADLANQSGVREFVMVSTDKAVNPTSIMGVTKRIAELYIKALSKKSSTKYVTVRFGNVLNSNGSVIPTFERQIEQAGPVTVTHPDIERYFMSISEAVQLVLQAVTMGKNGEIFILEMGKSIKIMDLATEMILQAGYKPYEDIQIKFTGLRRGEKLFEELIGKNEEPLPTSHASIKTLKINGVPTLEKISKDIDDVANICQHTDFSTLAKRLRAIVPEFDPDYQEKISAQSRDFSPATVLTSPVSYDSALALSAN